MHHCSVCGSKSQDPQWACIRGFDLVKCTSCGHLYVSEVISSADLEVAYDSNYYGADRSSSSNGTTENGYANYLGKLHERQRQFQQRLHLVSRFVQPAGRILDYGCAVGLFVKIAAEAGWSARGYERSAWAAQHGQSQWGLDITVADEGVDPFAPCSFDVVTLWDVLEHLQHPRAVLDSITRWIVPGGLIALNTVNSSSLGARLAGTAWRHLAPPHHLQYFSRHSLLRLLGDSGFRPVSIRAEGVLFDAKNECDHSQAWMAKLVEKLVLHWRFRPLATRLNLLDEITIIAAKV